MRELLSEYRDYYLINQQNTTFIITIKAYFTYFDIIIQINVGK